MNKSIRVLHIEDSEQDAALIARHLACAGYELISERVDTAEAMKAALERDRWNLILCDYSMPQFSALRALTLAQEMEVDLPFIIISGTIGEAVAVEAMRAGAHDYLMKDNLVRLVPTIERELNEAENRRARREADEQLHLQSVAMESAANAIMITDEKGAIIWVNYAFTETSGHSKDEVLGRNPRFLKSGKQDQAFYQNMWDTILAGKIWHDTLINRRKDGTFNHEDMTITPIRNKSGKRTHFVAIKHDITERTLAQEALQASELRYRRLFESAQDGILILDADSGQVVDVNPYLSEMLGFSKKELAGKIFWEIGPFKDIVASRVAFAQLREGGYIRYENLPLKSREGLTRQVEFVSNSYLAGSRVIQCNVRDITERKLAEAERERLAAEIENQRQRLNNIVATVPGVVWEAWGQPDAATQRNNFVSNYVETMLGYTVEDWLSTPNFWLTIIHPDDKEEAARAASEAFASGKSSRQEFSWIKKDGRAIWVESNYAVIKDEQDGAVGLRGVTTDISERKRAEEQLRRQLDFTEAITNSLGEGLYALDKNGLVTFMNPAAEIGLGWKQEQLLGQSMHEVIHFQKADCTRTPAEDCPLLGVLKSAQTVKVDRDVFTRKDRTIFPVSYTSSPIITQGQAVGAVIAFHDITERITLEEQFRQSQKMEAVGQLAGGVAHDFNNLLTVITGYSDLTLMRLGNDEPIRSNVEEIRKAGERAASLTRQLLAFSRKQVLQPKLLKLNVIVSDVEKMLRRLIGEDIDLLTVLEPSLGQINADPGQIEQVILNLAVNARDAMPQGGKLTVETSNVYLDNEYVRIHSGIRPGGYVMLAVNDTGTGMDGETQAHIFEPFYTTKVQGKGTGLGLSTVYGIVKQSGGNIWVYSEIGKGTTFKVYLPRVNDGGQIEAAPEPLADLSRGRETILLTEDEEPVRRLTRLILEMNGYQVLEATCGDEALSIYERHQGRVELIITDVVMPRMSGRELAQAPERLSPGIKVLYLSGYTDDAIVRHGLLDQKMAFLQKPFTPDALLRKVREMLETTHEN